MAEFDGSTALGLAAALGAGLLIGLERERRKRRRRGAAQVQAAGIRSFALVALAGGLAQLLAAVLGQPLLVLLGAALVAGLAVVAYARSLRLPATAGVELDPGLTTELALFVTYLVGVLAVQAPALGAGAAVVVATLLAARERLHRFATQALSEAELHDALILAALALVLLPLAPALPLPALQPWVPVAPRTLLLTVVLILTLQAAGHLAGRVFGPRAGLTLAGLCSGFVSSTATIVAMGSRVRAAAGTPAAQAATAGALASTVATWLQVLLLVVALAPGALPALLPVALAGAGTAGLTAFLAWRRLAAAGPPDEPAGRGAERGPLRVREALVMAALLAAVASAVATAQQHFGTLGVLGGAALAALADAHAPVAALAALQAADKLPPGTLVLGAWIAVLANALTRSLAAFTAGGRPYGAVVARSLALSTAAAAAALAFFR
ncbi:MAG: DUF4010 domain-containing protein [Ideonella sp. WA131b]|jgi:uncharacterized membrane protein (DUF4010 family)|nr:DUF4010 domain-containing protein [Ideonella sp. WA131b]